MSTPSSGSCNSHSQVQLAMLMSFAKLSFCKLTTLNRIFSLRSTIHIYVYFVVHIGKGRVTQIF